MNNKEIDNYKEDGFTGFVPVSKLRKNLSIVPESGGVYIVIRESDDAPDFLPVGTGGFFKRKNPNVSIDELKENYVADSKVLYIGKSNNLNTRIEQLIEFGAGKAVGHRGGRYLWQLADSENLVIAWKPTHEANPKDEEARMLYEFKSIHGKLPFANLVMPKRKD